MAAHASQLYAKNLENFIDLITTRRARSNLDFDDEVVAGACLTHEGEIATNAARPKPPSVRRDASLSETDGASMDLITRSRSSCSPPSSASR